VNMGTDVSGIRSDADQMLTDFNAVNAAATTPAGTAAPGTN
jgi:hypothetical protein